MRHRGMFTCIAVALGVGAALPAGANAQIVLPDFCKTATPHTTLSYAGSVISATSAGATYHTSPKPGCARFIVDIGVGPSKYLTLRSGYAGVATGPNPPFAGDALALSQPDCAGYNEYVAVYSRGPFLGSTFTQKASTSFKGVWVPAKFIEAIEFLVPAHCERAWVAGSPKSTLENHSSTAFGATFRVVVGAKITKGNPSITTWKQVKVTAGPA